MVGSYNFNELLSVSNVYATRQVLLIDSLNKLTNIKYVVTIIFVIQIKKC